MPACAIVGAGRFGRALCAALVDAGFQVKALCIRAGSQATTAQRSLRVPIRSGVGDFLSVLKTPTLVFICVQDREVEQVALELARNPGCSTHRYAHSCAVRGRRELQPLSEAKAPTGTFHLLQSFGPTRYAWQKIAGSWCAIEATGSFKRELFACARKIRARPFTISGGQRAAYHAAAVLASNAMVTLLEIGSRILKASGIDTKAAELMLLPLARATLENTAALGTAQALTGPVVRGDSSTVRLHLDILTGQDRSLYLALMLATLDLARRSGRLDERLAQQLKKLLDES